MASKQIFIPSVVTLTKQATQELAKILHAPSTEAQKKSVKKSVGVYTYYQEKWNKRHL